ncbi:peptidoglycan D,D-transpeptidase FtsI family protein [Weissella soli]|uniref:peptidoglycan D,D-transpeptidase FtsI family protein n=1 Tax=Weissella soli TaxID=155866 RepID=UPI0035A017AD
MASSKRRRRARSRISKNSLSRIPIRLNVLMGIVILMLAALGMQLVKLQISQHDKFVAQITSNSESTETEKVQRGMIYDSTGKVILANKGSKAITYTRPKSVTTSDMYHTANAVGNHLQVDTKTLSKANYAVYYIQDDKRRAKVAAALKNPLPSGSDAYIAQLEAYVQKHEAKFPLTKDQENKAMLYQKMANAYALSTVYLKETDVTDKEIAEIGERQSKMPGVKVGLYYTRDYPNGTAMKSLIGSVSTSKTGLPDSSVNQLLSQGYARDDSVGTSYLEQFYEATLRGTKKKYTVTTNGKTDKTTKTTLYAGQAGNNLRLTVNSKFQADVQKILEEQMPDGLTQGAYAVIINPKTGAIYAMAGSYRDNKTGEKASDPLGTINRSFPVGSVVKPAMITTALLNNVITTTNNTITDVPIKIAGTATKASYFNTDGSDSIALDIPTALKMSSNSYVMQLMLKMGGLTYHSGMSLTGLDSNVWNKMRNGLGLFGLGQMTGIDLPGETSGVRGSTDSDHTGNTLDESFGQYDTYTTMQLAQYAATVANGGYRVRPHVVDAILSRSAHSSKSTVATSIATQVLGTVGWTKAERDLIYEGMYQVVHGSGYATGTGLKDLMPEVYAKTGTAETTTDGEDTYSSTAISFVPNANVAVAVAIPGISSQTSDSVSIPMSHAIWKAFWQDVENKGSSTK